MNKTVLPNDLVDLVAVAAGLESNVYHARSPDGRSFILKKRSPKGHQNYLFEAYAYRELGLLECKVPQVFYVDENQLLMSVVSGRELDDQESLFENTALFTDIAKNLALCRMLTFSGFGKTVETNNQFTGEYSIWLDYIGTIENVFTSDAMRNSGLSDAECSRLKQYWFKTKNEMELKTGSLVHGDFAMSAIFVDKGKFQGLIDFGDAFIGDPLMDIAYFRFKEITKDYGDGLYQQLLRAYANTAQFTVDAGVERKILFYMIYWGLVRISHCPDKALRLKFAEKLRIVGGMLS